MEEVLHEWAHWAWAIEEEGQVREFKFMIRNKLSFSNYVLFDVHAAPEIKPREARLFYFQFVQFIFCSVHHIFQFLEFVINFYFLFRFGEVLHFFNFLSGLAKVLHFFHFLFRFGEVLQFINLFK